MTTPRAIYNVLAYGANGDGQYDCTSAIQKAIDVCTGNGGGMVYLPPGAFLSGPLTLGSNVNLYLEAGAVLLASSRVEDYPQDPDDTPMESGRVGLLTAKDAHNISITGRGTLDGRGQDFLDHESWKVDPPGANQYTRQGEDFMHPRYGTQHGPLEVLPTGRPGNMLRFYRCTDLLIQDVTLANSPAWTLHLHECESANITGLRIHSPGSDWRTPNDDGIDLRFCRRVRISNCDIDTGDDCIAVFGSQQVVVTNCTLSSRSAGVRVGYDLGDVRDCVFGNLVIDANRGLNLNVRASTTIENVLFHDIILRTHLITGQWWGKGEPIHISTGRMDASQPLGYVRNVRFRNILAESDTGILLYGCAESPIQEVVMEGVHLTIKASPLQASYGGNFDLRAMADPQQALFAHDIPGVYACHVHGLTLRDFRLEWEPDVPEFYTHGFECENFKNLHIDRFAGGPARPSCKAVVLREGTGAWVRRSQAIESEIDIFHLGHVELD
jgi:polygalacturonase